MRQIDYDEKFIRRANELAIIAKENGEDPFGAVLVKENEIVYELKNGLYMAIFDSFGDQEIGYSTSTDGVHWNKETRIKIQSKDNLWAEPGDHYTRTPLCAIEEDDGTYTVVYTAMTKVNGKNFYAIGKCSIAWK